MRRLATLEARVVENPAYISVVVRWITWAVAFFVVVFGAAPVENLRNGLAMLVVTGIWCVAISVYGPALPLWSQAALLVPRGGWFREHAAEVAGVFDVLFSALVIYETGGYRSPFYEFALTSVIAPALLFRIGVALAAAALFDVAYFAAVINSRPGLEAAIRNGQMDGTLFSTVLNPFTVAIFCSLLGHVLDQLQRARHQARDLAAREERARIAREIHDGIAQRVFMIGLTLETCADLADRGAPGAELGKRLRDLMGVSKQALWEVRHYIFDLKPLLEGDASFSKAAKNQVHEFKAISGIPVTLQVEGEETPLSVAVSTAAFRSIQEAMANVYKHAAASSVSVVVRFGERFEVEVQDDGRGFDPGGAPEGRGLEGMRQRVEEAGGRLAVSSSPSGTRVTVTF